MIARRLSVLAAFAAALFGPAAGFAQTANPISLDLVSSVRFDRTRFDYTYRVRWANTSAGQQGSSGPYLFRITGTPAGTTVLEGDASFAWFPPNADAVSTDTITLRVDRTIPFQPSAITWQYHVIGRFVGPPVAGLNYSFAGGAGITDAQARYTAPLGADLTFQVGAVVLGTAAGIGQTTITEMVGPTQLVSGGTATTPAVVNISRFLQMLDSDANSGNGIQISAAIRTAAAAWAPVDFAAANIETRLASLAIAARAADGGTHPLPGAANTTTLLRNSYYCARSGIYFGVSNRLFPGDFAEAGAIVAQPNRFNVGFYVFDQEDNAINFMSGGSTGHDDALNGAFTNTLNFGAGDYTITGSTLASTSVYGLWQIPTPKLAFLMGNRAPGPYGAWRFTATSGVFVPPVSVLLFELHLPSLSTGATVSGFLHQLPAAPVATISGSLTGNTITATAGAFSISGTLSGLPSSPQINGIVTSAGVNRNYFSQGCLDL